MDIRGPNLLLNRTNLTIQIKVYEIRGQIGFRTTQHLLEEFSAVSEVLTLTFTQLGTRDFI